MSSSEINELVMNKLEEEFTEAPCLKELYEIAKKESLTFCPVLFYEIWISDWQNRIIFVGFAGENQIVPSGWQKNKISYKTICLSHEIGHYNFAKKLLFSTKILTPFCRIALRQDSCLFTELGGWQEAIKLIYGLNIPEEEKRSLLREFARWIDYADSGQYAECNKLVNIGKCLRKNRIRKLRLSLRQLLDIIVQ